MNPNTGRVYFGEQEINDAKERGEPVVEVPLDVAAAQQVGQALLADIDPRMWLQMSRKERRAAMRASRKALRRHGGLKRFRRVGIR